MEGELDSKRSELQKLKDEETSLEREYDTNKHELDSLTRTLQDTQIQISQVRTVKHALVFEYISIDFFHLAQGNGCSAARESTSNEGCTSRFQVGNCRK